MHIGDFGLARDISDDSADWKASFKRKTNKHAVSACMYMYVYIYIYVLLALISCACGSVVISSNIKQGSGRRIATTHLSDFQIRGCFFPGSTDFFRAIRIHFTPSRNLDLLSSLATLTPEQA